MVAVCVLLFGLAFIQDPGLLTSDTKFDLVAAPGDLLARALHLWDAQGAFGQLQNQAYGYLWPMGPFFLLGSVLDIKGWVVQRLWLGLVMSVAFVGSARVSRALGVRSDTACVVAGLAFALSPRMLSTLGPISIEAWPSAVAPWVLLPLIRGAVEGSPRRAAALSGLAVAMVGGLNASATFAVVPLGVVWLLTRSPGSRRRVMMVWWPAFTVLGTLWWLVPLFVMGAYTPPFLDFIETTSVTTFPTTLFDTLRGTSDWVPYIDAGSRAGNDLVRTSYLVLNSGVVLLLGFAGLIDRRSPHRLFLVLSVLAGVLMVSAGHDGAVQGWFAHGIRGFLDGSLSPLRNVHKFDPILRLPLVMGVGLVVDRMMAARAAGPASAESDVQRSLDQFNRSTVLAMTVVVVAGAAVPAFAGRLTPARPVLDVPAYWGETATWLSTHSDGGTALVVPGSPFADYVWGSPKDEPLQFLASTPWATRNVIPLAPPGNIRMLGEVEDRFAQGAGSPGLAAYLGRAGVQYLVVRNDLRRGDDIPDPAVVHQVLDDSPGLSRVAEFGPDVGGGAHLTRNRQRILINGGWQSLYPAVEVYQVASAQREAVSSGSPVVVVAGGPEDLLDLQDLGVIGDNPVVLAADTPLPQGLRGANVPVVLTDGLKARERFFARIHDGYSAALTPGDEPHSGNPSRDYTIDQADRWSTTVRLSGARSLSASSSGSDSNALGGTKRGQLPYAAVDGSSETAWVSGVGKADRAWWKVEFDEPRAPTRVLVSGGPDASENQTVRVRTSYGLSQPVPLGPGETRSVLLDGHRRTPWLRVEDASTSSGRTISLAEVHLDGLKVVRQLVLPRLPSSWGNPSAIVVRADRDARTGCLTVGGTVRCVQGRSRASEEQDGSSRVVTLNQGGSYVPDLTVRPHPGTSLDGLLLRNQPVEVIASSSAVPDPRASAVAAIDGDPGTTWIADSDDPRPTLRLNWLGKKRITGLSVTRPIDTAARRPTRVTITWPGGSRQLRLDDRGRASLPAIRTDQLRLRVDQAESMSNLDFNAQGTPVGVGIGDLRLDGLPYLPVALPTEVADLPCGTGPEVTLAGRRYDTSVEASAEELGRGESAPAHLCTSPSARPGRHEEPQPLDLDAGENAMTISSSPSFDFQSLTLTDPESSSTIMPVNGADVQDDGPSKQRIEPASGADLVGVRQNFNAGWRASQAGASLQPVVLDGWQQGWILQKGDAGVRATFAPDGPYRWGLGAGLVGLAGLLVTVLVMRLRRRTDENELPALGDRPLSPVVVALTAMVGAALLAGWQGLLVAAVVSVVASVAQDRNGVVAPWLLAAPCLVVATAYSITPWGSASGWAGNDAWLQYVMLVPLASALCCAGAGRPRFLSFIAGSSTRR